MLSVYVDNVYSFSIPEEEYLRLNLYEKTSISEEEIEEIKKSIALRNIKSSGIKLITYKLLSEKELFLKLVAKGYDEDIVSMAIEELKSMGYINDMIYAQKFVHER